VKPISISVGVAEYVPKDTHISVAELVRVADEAMYKVKEQGGNGIYSVSLEGVEAETGEDPSSRRRRTVPERS
jgi:hypothetical protein